jgi:predicted branched-subunit amino acid permease
MRLMSGLIYVGGVALIVAAFLKKKQKPIAIVPEEARSAAGQR